MKLLTFILFTVIIISNISNAQEFKFPESAAFDPSANCYFISNYGAGDIIQIDTAGVKTYFKQGLSKPLGMIIYNNILYVVDNPQSVKGFDISNGSQTTDIKINEALFLNDITCDNSGNLYVTDSQGNFIYIINIKTQSYKPFFRTISEDPNGIIYDKFNDRLLVCYFKEKSQIDKINLKDSTMSTILLTDTDNLDGITLDESGNCYVSSWGIGDFSNGFNEGGKIYKYDSGFKKKSEIIFNGPSGPADIYFNSYKNEIVIPLFLENKVTFFSLNRK